MSGSCRYDMNRPKDAMLLIANDGPLGPEWLDHPLRGDWEGHRECHIGGDFYRPTSAMTAESMA